ncbi:MAG: hypothetical protein V2I33_07880 [Kangiellaceae bacterium]|jgi:hypothetical protein|nr:hypothetical protein [Kangiellaceae bacterium]
MNTIRKLLFINVIVLSWLFSQLAAADHALTEHSADSVCHWCLSYTNDDLDEVLVAHNKQLNAPKFVDLNSTPFTPIVLKSANKSHRCRAPPATL